MKKQILITLSAVGLLLGGCHYNEDNFEGLDKSTEPTNVFSKEYLLLDEDYATISKNTANGNIAREAGVSSQLTRLATDKYFTSTITAKQYIPAYLAARYFTADAGSAIKMTYQEMLDQPEYMTVLNKATIYTLAAADYKKAWGTGGTLRFFSPAKPAATYLPEILKEKIANPKDGQVICASFNLADTEPVSPTDAGTAKYLLTNALYSYNGTVWKAYTANNAIMMSLVDFQPMGSKYDNFDATRLADTHLPVFLNLKYPYAQEEDEYVAVYKYYASGSTTIKADKYVFAEGKFVKENWIETVVSQFVYSGGKWNFDPSTVITLPAVRSDPLSTAFYTAIVEAVNVANPSYVSSHGNNEYYYGSSYYNNNFDFRPSAWKGQAPNVYGDMKDAELTKLMFDRLPEACAIALKALYSSAEPVEGIDVIYTINFIVYDGASTPYVIKYKVSGKGQFEYIDKSLQKVG